MRFTGKISEFNRTTGHGLISSKATGGKLKFHVSQAAGGNWRFDAGASVEFEVGFVDGVSQALAVTLMSRIDSRQESTVKARVGKAFGDDRPAVAPEQPPVPPLPVVKDQATERLKRESFSIPAPLPTFSSSAVARTASGPKDKDECSHCGKLMVPRLVTFKGQAARSLCPFCGGVHKDFTEDKAGPGTVVLGGLVTAALGALLGG